MFAILQRQNLVPRPVAAILVNPSLEELGRHLAPDIQWAVDCETNGTDVTLPDTKIVGLGFSNDRTTFYIDLLQLQAEQCEHLLYWMYGREFVAFNIFFDGAFLQKLTGCWLDFFGDAYGLFKQLSSEGHPGQKWNLETAQLQVLGWPTSNKDAMNAALKERGLTKAEMWQLPPDVLGKYCAEDADSTWQLWKVLTNVCEPAGLSPSSVPV